MLDAIKAELNRNLRPGRYVLTGSTSYTTLPRASQALTGRVHVLPAVIEGSDARIAAIEVKASSQVRPTDLRGLRLLRDRFPDRFVGGTVLYLGPLAYAAEDRIHVVPLDCLWM